MLLFFSPLTPSNKSVITYCYEGMLITLGIYSVYLLIKIIEAKNLPAIALFCLS